MSNSDQDEVGYGKPPRKHRFSVENQPKRRRSKVPKGLGHDLLANILHALGEDVSIMLNGKPTKAKAGYVFARRLVKQGVGGTLNDQIKLANLLKAYGELDPDSIREDVEKSVGEEHKRALEEEQSRNAELVGCLKDCLDLIEGCRRSLRVIGNGFLGARSTCTCGSFDDCSEAEQAVVEWFEDDDPSIPDGEPEKILRVRNRGWASSKHGGLESEAPPDDVAKDKGPLLDEPLKVLKDGGIVAGPRGDDLTAGMIGND